MTKRCAFTLVEIMIVVGIIALLAAIAIPHLLRTRINANESSAIATLRTIASAYISFRSVNTAYPTVLASMASPNTTPPYIDTILGCSGTTCAKSGYSFAMTGGANTFTATAVPQNYQVSGIRSFYLDESGVIYFTAANSAVSTNDSVLE